MNKIAVILFSVFAAAMATTCYTNGTAFATTCVAGNTNCTFIVADLWSNCNNASPAPADDVVVISGTSAYTLTSNVTAVASLKMSGTGGAGIVSIQGPLTVGTVQIEDGTLQIQSAVTLAANSSLVTKNNVTIEFTSGSITTAGGVATISIEPAANFNVGTGAKSNINYVNQGEMRFKPNSDLTLDGASGIYSNGSIRLDGNVMISGTAVGDAYSQLQSVGTFAINTGGGETATINVQSVISSSLTLSNGSLTTKQPVTINNDVTVYPAATLNIQDSWKSAPMSFYAKTFTNNGTVNWSSGMNFVLAQGQSFVNYGVVNFNSDTALLLVPNGTATIQNWGTSIVNGNTTFSADQFVNRGTLTVNKDLQVIGQSSNQGFGTSSIDTATGLNGTGKITFKGNVNWYAGQLAVDTTILGNLNVAQDGSKTLATTAFSAVNITMSGPLAVAAPAVTISQTDIFGSAGAVFMPATGMEALSMTLMNSGLHGSLVFDRVNLDVDQGYMGTPSNPIVNMTVMDAFLNVANTTHVVVGMNGNIPPIVIQKTGRNMTNQTVGALISANVTIILLDGYSPSNGNVSVVRVDGIAKVDYTGATFNIIAQNNSNTNKCNYTRYMDLSKMELFISFEGCETPATSTGKGGLTKTQIIIIVVVVVSVVVIGAIIGVVIYRRRQAAHPSEKQRLI